MLTFRFQIGRYPIYLASDIQKVITSLRSEDYLYLSLTPGVRRESTSSQRVSRRYCGPGERLVLSA
jgi:hypothetical protein